MTFLAKKTPQSLPLTPLNAGAFDGWLKEQDARVKAWVKAAGFTGAAGAALLLPDAKGKPERVVFGAGAEDSLYTAASLPARLAAREGGYYFDAQLPAERATRAALGWALGSYEFTRYKTGKTKTFAQLVWPEKADRAAVTAAADSVFLVRDLVNTPPSDLGPAELAQAARKIGGGAVVKIISGPALEKFWPAVHAVGKGSPRAPRLIDIRWGTGNKPLVTLVGKGVCFDTGGLNLKPGKAMELMKKDMGGAAHALGLARMIMAHKLPVRLRVLIPAVENSVDGHSFRPSDVLQTRKGITVEIGDTDAEGRLVLCDALAEACTEKPALIIDFATLTGAARVALGPDLPALFCNDDKTAEAFLAAARETEDPVWRLPLHRPYADSLKSSVADMNNIGADGFAGAITAALFLDKFVDRDIPWVHLDTYAWNASDRPGRPRGGEALGMRAAFRLIENTFGKKKT